MADLEKVVEDIGNFLDNQYVGFIDSMTTDSIYFVMRDGTPLKVTVTQEFIS